MTQAKKALYATVGAGEAAIERVKSLPKQVNEVRGRLTDGSLRELPKTAIETAKTGPGKVAELFSTVTKRVEKVTGRVTKRATKNFNSYAKRGEKLVKRITKSAPRAAGKNKSAKSRTKAATTIHSAVEADVETVKRAAETVAADVG